MKELVRLIPAPDVHRRQTRLEQDAGRQVAPLPDLAVGGDLPVTGDLAEAVAKLVHGDVHGLGDVPLGELLGRAYVEHEGTAIRRGVVDALKLSGYDVAEAADGDSGLAACEAAASTPAVAAGGEPYDLLLTDVVMPGRLNGRALAGEVLRRWPGMRVVFMSGYSDDALMEDGRLAADVLLLGKPFRKSDLAQMLRRAFDTASDRPLEIPARPDRAPA